MTRVVSIHPSVFELLPTFQRIVFHCNVFSSIQFNAELDLRLSKAVKDAADFDLKSTEIEVWEMAHRSFASNPNRYPPSIKALIKRCKSQRNLPYINSLVATMNLISLEFMLPCGGDDLSKTIGNLTLRAAKGDEQFYSLSKPELLQMPNKNEIIYVDQSKQVMCRKLNWQNSYNTKLTDDTRELVFNVDTLATNHEGVERIIRTVKGYLQKYCSTDADAFLLNDQKSTKIICAKKRYD